MTRLIISVAFRSVALDLKSVGYQMCQPCIKSIHSMDGYHNLHSKKCLNLRLYTTSKGKSSESGSFKDKSVAKLDAFSETVDKNKESYLDLLHFYKMKDVHRRGHVEFIYAALRHMKEFGVHKDLETYKALIEVMPKGKFVAQNVLQAEFQHYPKQQQVIIDLLEEMEVNAVCPDEEMEDILVNIFGRRSFVIRRYWRMMYWMPKLKNLSPWPVPDPLPDDGSELATEAIKRITSVDPATFVSVMQTKEIKDSIDDTWIVSGQSPLQKRLIKDHKKTEPLYVEGAFRVWLREASVNYFILRADPDPNPLPDRDPDDISRLTLPLFEPPPPDVGVSMKTVHEQEDGTVMAVCASGSSSRDSLLSWIRLLQRDNPDLGEIPILFTLKSPLGDTEPLKEIEGEVPLAAVATDPDRL